MNVESQNLPSQVQEIADHTDSRDILAAITQSDGHGMLRANGFHVR